MNFKNNKTLLQLRDCVLNVAQKKSKLAIAEMFTTELKFAGAGLFKWFNKKYISKNLELSNEEKKENMKLNFLLIGKMVAAVYASFYL